MTGRKLLLVTAAISGMLSHPAGAAGPYEVKSETKWCDSLDITDRQIEVWYPATGSHPLISYAHGLLGGGSITRSAYDTLLTEIASYGYIVVAPRSCNIGCWDGESLPEDPPGFGRFYHEQIKAITCARQFAAGDDPVFSHLSLGAAVGISGHSMGGQATLFSSASKDFDPRDYNITAAVMHHAFTHQFPAPTIPYLAITGSADTTAPPSMTEAFRRAAADSVLKARGYANKEGATHLLPNGADGEDEARALGRLSAAFFKLYVDCQAVSDDGTTNYEDIIFGSGPDSLCGGGYGKMAACVTERTTPPPTLPPAGGGDIWLAVGVAFAGIVLVVGAVAYFMRRRARRREAAASNDVKMLVVDVVKPTTGDGAMPTPP